MKGWLILFVLIVGIALGAGGALFGPDFVEPYLPQAFRGKPVTVEGSVVEKQRKGPELLLTINTPQGALLATMSKRVPEVELLVNKGDSVELVLKKYEPFIKDPKIKRVRKGVARPAAEMPEEEVAAPQPLFEKTVKPEKTPPVPEKPESPEIPESMQQMEAEPPAKVEEEAGIKNTPSGSVEEKQPSKSHPQ